MSARVIHEFEIVNWARIDPKHLPDIFVEIISYFVRTKVKQEREDNVSSPKIRYSGPRDHYGAL